MDLDFEKAILVVGSDETYKSCAAKALSLQPQPVSKTLGGEVYGRSLRDPWEADSAGNTSPFVIDKSMRFGEIVVNTSPFPEEQRKDAVKYEQMWQFAQSWISLNSLQELNGRQMSVVCVINTILPGLSERTSSATDSPTWLSLLRYIFDPARVPITFLVFKPHGSIDTVTVKTLLQQNLAKQRFGNLSDVILQYGTLEVGAKLEIPSMRFVSHSKLVKLHGHWDPVKVILFGRTGSGKSTLAQMLTNRRLDSGAKTFAASSSARGKTVQVDWGFNSKWLVVDTPGLGETRDELATIDTETAVMKIYEDVREKHGVFTHYIYVCKQARHDLLEEDTWNCFVRVFGEKIAQNFTVVITKSSPKWIDEYKDRLRVQFKGCNHFLSVQFPPIDENDSELEEENQAERLESLRQLEEGLTILQRNEVSGKYGDLSEMAVDSEKAFARHWRNSESSMGVRAVASAVSVGVSVVGIVAKGWHEARRDSDAKKAREEILGHGTNFDHLRKDSGRRE